VLIPKFRRTVTSLISPTRSASLPCMANGFIVPVTAHEKPENGQQCSFHKLISISETELYFADFDRRRCQPFLAQRFPLKTIVCWACSSLSVPCSVCSNGWGVTASRLKL